MAMLLQFVKTDSSTMNMGLLMKRLGFLLALNVLSVNAFAADFVTGTIIKKNNKFFIKNSEGELKIETTDLILKSLPSLYDPSFVKQANKKPYAFEFKGELRDNAFKLTEVPTNIPGAISLRGVLKYDKSSKTYSINNHKAIFGYTKVLSGYKFDEISQKSFVGKDLIIDGDYNDDGDFVIQALTPANLLSASTVELQDQAERFILDVVPQNESSQHAAALRRTAYQAQGTEVSPGDGALIVTLSGRQGDTFGSVNGHFVAGIAEVRDDLSLRGEVSNAYVTNEKDILSGNTSLTNYFSHLVQGQNIYRPTYTLIVYGIAKEKLKQFRDALEASHIQFRTNKLDITPQFNCTTETVKALKDAGIEGRYVQIDNSIEGVIASPLKLGGTTADSLQFAVANDPSRYQPATAFESFVKSFLHKKTIKKLGITRVDYVFYPQIASNRPVGGMALGSVVKALKFKKLYDTYEVNEKTKIDTKALREKLQILQEIPYK